MPSKRTSYTAVIGAMQEYSKRIDAAESMKDTAIMSSENKTWGISWTIVGNTKTYSSLKGELVVARVEGGVQVTGEVRLVRHDCREEMVLPNNDKAEYNRLRLYYKYRPAHEPVNYQSSGLGKIDKLFTGTTAKSDANDFAWGALVLMPIPVPFEIAANQDTGEGLRDWNCFCAELDKTVAAFPQPVPAEKQESYDIIKRVAAAAPEVKKGVIPPALLANMTTLYKSLVLDINPIIKRISKPERATRALQLAGQIRTGASQKAEAAIAATNQQAQVIIAAAKAQEDQSIQAAQRQVQEVQEQSGLFNDPQDALDYLRGQAASVPDRLEEFVVQLLRSADSIQSGSVATAAEKDDLLTLKKCLRLLEGVYAPYPSVTRLGAAAAAGRMTVQAIAVVQEYLHARLQQLGITPIDPMRGQKFDPRLHQMFEGDSAEWTTDHSHDNCVFSVVRLGFLFKEQTLRMAVVRRYAYISPAEASAGATATSLEASLGATSAPMS